MISTTLDLSFAIGAFVLLPLIIWENLHNRQSGLMGYLWRESPSLVRIGLVFLGLIWLAAAQELATYYSLLSLEAAQTLSIALAIPMFLLSLTILVMAGMVIARYLRSRQGA